LAELERPASSRSAVGVVLASEGYPQQYRTGYPISGLDNVDNAIIFHAGTAWSGGEIVTDGGRVLCVVGLGESIATARDAAYAAADRISFEGAWKRSDIALREA
jgi:phosphoribosylamine--glycine ligase